MMRVWNTFGCLKTLWTWRRFHLNLDIRYSVGLFECRHCNIEGMTIKMVKLLSRGQSDLNQVDVTRKIRPYTILIWAFHKQPCSNTLGPEYLTLVKNTHPHSLARAIVRDVTEYVPWWYNRLIYYSPSGAANTSWFCVDFALRLSLFFFLSWIYS